jgi:hypothetical protein
MHAPVSLVPSTESSSPPSDALVVVAFFRASVEPPPSTLIEPNNQPGTGFASSPMPIPHGTAHLQAH